MDVVIRAVQKKGYKMEVMQPYDVVVSEGVEGYVLWWPNHYAAPRVEDGKFWMVDSMDGQLPREPLKINNDVVAGVIRVASGGRNGKIAKVAPESNRKNPGTHYINRLQQPIFLYPNS